MIKAADEPFDPLPDWLETIEGEEEPIEYIPDARPPADELKQLCRDFFAPGGILSRASLNGTRSEERPQQLEMALSIADALADGEHRCIEAPTGVGKSFAYLVPLIYRSRFCARPAVISTETINLQEQLIEKDIPLLKQLMQCEIRAALAKGRRNYLCRRRFALLSGDQRDALLPVPSLVGDVERLQRVIEMGFDGERDALDFQVDSSTWNLVCCESGNCLGPKCEFFRNCYYQRARRQWEEADVIVANHALFFTDLAMRCGGDAAGTLLPNYGAVMIDEAHTLEDNAADHLGMHLSRSGVIGVLNRLYNPDSARGLLMRQGSEIVSLRAQVAAARDEAYGFFSPYEELLLEHRESTLRLLRPEPFPDRLSPMLRKLNEGLGVLAESIDDASFRSEVETQQGRCREFIDTIDALNRQTRPDTVYYAESDRSGVMLHGAPLNVAELLREMLFKQDFPVMLCSATLTVRKSFDYFISRTGFSGGKTLLLNSPFSPEQARFLIPRQMPDPASDEYLPALIETIPRMLELTDGKGFVLFTSYHAMRQCADALRDDFAARGWRLFVQGCELPRNRMLEEFRRDVNSVLFGTDSFWTGVDVPGEALSNVIVTKLPFAVPTHPLIQARIERLEAEHKSAFGNYSLPEAVLKFRQGVGRLIRRQSDTGVIAVLDRRLLTKNYGRAFIDSIPFPVEYC